jgi:hypothetical protein
MPSVQPAIAAYAGRQFIGGATAKGRRFVCVNAALKKIGDADSLASSLKIIAAANKRSKTIH